MNQEPYLRQFERLADELQKDFLFPHCQMERTRDCIQITIPDEIYRKTLGSDHDLGIILLLTPDHIEIRLPIVDWTQGAYGPVSSSRSWKRLKIDDYATDRLSQEELTSLLDLITQGIEKRRKEFRRCRKCGEVVEVLEMKQGKCETCNNGGVPLVY